MIANGEIAFLWLGAAVSPQILNDLYGVENLDEIDTRIVRILLIISRPTCKALITTFVDPIDRPRYPDSLPTSQPRSETFSLITLG